MKNLEELQQLIGNEQLAAIRAKQTDIQARVGEWRKAKDLIAKRQEVWNTVEAMAGHAEGLGDAKSALQQVESIRTERLLVEASDPVTPMRAALAETLRKRLAEAHERHRAEYVAGVASLNSSKTWQQINEADQARILGDVELMEPEKPDVGSDEALLRALDTCNLAARKAEADAVAGRGGEALRRAAQLLEPEVQFVAVERATLKTEEDVREWLGRQEKKLIEAVREGPVQVQ